MKISTIDRGYSPLWPALPNYYPTINLLSSFSGWDQNHLAPLHLLGTHDNTLWWPDFEDLHAIPLPHENQPLCAVDSQVETNHGSFCAFGATLCDAKNCWEGICTGWPVGFWKTLNVSLNVSRVLRDSCNMAVQRCFHIIGSGICVFSGLMAKTAYRE